jgi:hypothetical protein
MTSSPNRAGAKHNRTRQAEKDEQSSAYGQARTQQFQKRPCVQSARLLWEGQKDVLRTASHHMRLEAQDDVAAKRAERWLEVVQLDQLPRTRCCVVHAVPGVYVASGALISALNQ